MDLIKYLRDHPKTKISALQMSGAFNLGFSKEDIFKYSLKELTQINILENRFDKFLQNYKTELFKILNISQL